VGDGLSEERARVRHGGAILGCVPEPSQLNA